MAYTNVPVTINESFSVSQPKITQNFIDINTAISQDHVTINIPVERGKHKQVTFPEQAGDPATLANEKAMYAKQSAISGTAELFIRDENNGAVIEFTSAINAVNGWTRLPSGVKIAWSTETAPAGTQTVPVVFPGGGFTNPSYSVQVTAKGTHAGVNTQYYVMSVTDVTNAGFNLQRGGTFHDRNIDFSYLAIGI